MNIPNTKDIVWEKVRPDHYRSGKYALDRTRYQGKVSWVVWRELEVVGYASTLRGAKKVAYEYTWRKVQHAYCTNPDCGCASL